jgi:hypothetical protein
MPVNIIIHPFAMTPGIFIILGLVSILAVTIIFLCMVISEREDE